MIDTLPYVDEPTSILEVAKRGCGMPNDPSVGCVGVCREPVVVPDKIPISSLEC